jgi:hypothetical protein
LLVALFVGIRGRRRCRVLVLCFGHVLHLIFSKEFVTNDKG